MSAIVILQLISSVLLQGCVSIRVLYPHCFLTSDGSENCLSESGIHKVVSPVRLVIVIMMCVSVVLYLIIWEFEAVNLFISMQNRCTCSDNKVCELIAVKVLHTSLLKTTMVTFKLLPLGSYAPMPVPSPPFKTIWELILWNGLQSCHCIIPDVISVIKMPFFQYFLYLWEQKEVTGR